MEKRETNGETNLGRRAVSNGRLSELAPPLPLRTLVRVFCCSIRLPQAGVGKGMEGEGVMVGMG